MLLKKLITQYSQIIGSAILPPPCVLCGGFTFRKQNLCISCLHDLPEYPPHCDQCGQTQKSKFENPNHLCGKCVQTKPAFDRTYPLFSYEAPIIRMLLQLKFKGELHFAQTFAELFLQKIEVWYKKNNLPGLIIPIPLHPKRLQERGFNQSLEIAKPIGRQLKIPIDPYGTKRIKPTLPQMGLSANKRHQNMHQAFSSVRDYSGVSIAILDDVITTGETVSEFCRMLKRTCGVKNIHVWCCARR